MLFALIFVMYFLLYSLAFMSVSMTQVKQIMEEAVTRKFVHEDSGHIVSFCGKSSVKCFSGKVYLFFCKPTYVPYNPCV